MGTGIVLSSFLLRAKLQSLLHNLVLYTVQRRDLKLTAPLPTTLLQSTMKHLIYNWMKHQLKHTYVISGYAI